MQACARRADEKEIDQSDMRRSGCFKDLSITLPVLFKMVE